MSGNVFSIPKFLFSIFLIFDCGGLICATSPSDAPLETSRQVVVAYVVNDCVVVFAPETVRLSSKEFGWLSSMVATLTTSLVPQNQSPVLTYGPDPISEIEWERLKRQETTPPKQIKLLSADNFEALLGAPAFKRWAGEKILAAMRRMVEAARPYKENESSENFDLYSHARKDLLDALTQRFQVASQHTVGCEPD